MILKPFQQVAVGRILKHRKLALFAEQGCGKTYITMGVLEVLAATQAVTALLVVPLANLVTTWQRSIQRELPQYEIHGDWDSFRKSKHHHRVLLINYEQILDRKYTKKLVKYEWDVIVYDESQRLKSRGTRAGRAAKRFKHGEYRLALSGTPIDDDPMDLWAQLRFVDEDVLGARWSDFERRWLKPTGYMGYKRMFRMELLPQFLETIAPVVMRIRKEDVLDLPAMRIIRSEVSLLGDQARLYRELDEEMVTHLRDGTEIVADMEITKLVRLQQIVGGFLTVGDRRVKVGRAKQRRLARILRRERKSGPIVVFTKYKDELEDAVEIAERLDLRVATVSGANKKTRVSVITRFQAGEIDVLVCQIKAGGVGLDLQNACVGVVYSATFSSIDFEQAVARLHRMGQTREVRIYMVCATNTVDNTIHLALKVKKRTAEQVLDSNPRRKIQP